MNQFLISFIKYYFIFLCNAWCFLKLLPHPQRSTKKQAFIILASGIFVSAAIFALRLRAKSMTAAALAVLSACTCAGVFHVAIDMALPATVMAYSLSTLFYAIALLPVAGLEQIPGFSDSRLDILYAVIIGGTQLLLSILLFRIRRLRRGLPFLADSRYGDLGVCLSILILIVVTFLGLGIEHSGTILVLLCMLLLCAVTQWFWWKKRTSTEYQQRLQQREMQAMEMEVEDMRHRIAELQSDCEHLSKMIHRDNKLIPAMVLSVEDFFRSVNNMDAHSIADEAATHLVYLKTISQERNRELLSIHGSRDDFPKTNVLAVDAMISLMRHRAVEHNIGFTLHCSCDLKEVADSTVSKHDLSTLLADLIDNALIAVQHSDRKKRVRADLLCDGDVFKIRIWDTGAPFPQEVLDKWGKQRITTHRDSGGSGIGMMTTYEICKRNHARFSVHTTKETGEYTKFVEVSFDGKSNFSCD